MKRLVQPLAFALALLVALTSQQMAMARGQTMAVGQVILCTGAGAVSISVDAEGNPTGPAHICPDCALTLVMATALAAPDAARPFAVRPVVWPLQPGHIALAAKVQIPTARGPPVLI